MEKIVIDLLNLTQIYSPFSFKVFHDAFIRIQFYMLHDSIKLGLSRRLAWQPFIGSLLLFKLGCIVLTQR